jgi:hypothetical protein
VISARLRRIFWTRREIRMNTFYRLFTDHPRSVGESYFEHMGSAFYFGVRMIAAGIACMLHGLFPFLFVKTGSLTVRHLHDVMISHRSRQRAAPEWLDHGAFI